MALTRTPRGPNSAAIDLVRGTIAALAATKGLCSCSGTRPAMEAMLMMRPAPRASMARLAAAGGAADEEGAVQVDIDDAVPFLGRELFQRDPVRHRVDAGVVDQDVDVAEAREHGFDGVLDGRFVADVEAEADGAGEFGGGGFGALGGHVVYDDGGAVAGEGAGDGAAD